VDPLDPGPEVATVERAAVAPGDVAATVGRRAITVASLKPLLGGRLFPLESQQYSLRRTALDKAVDRVLLDQEARKRGVDVRELVRQELDKRVATRSREELLSQYRKVRVVFRHFPLSMHPRAAKAAECAGEQGRFWEMHDKLFGASDLEDAALKRYAADLGIGGERFNTCLDAGTYAWKWQRDRREGEHRSGVCSDVL
jgi:hypothetical protein